MNHSDPAGRNPVGDENVPHRIRDGDDPVSSLPLAWAPKMEIDPPCGDDSSTPDSRGDGSESERMTVMRVQDGSGIGDKPEESEQRARIEAYSPRRAVNRNP